MTTTRPSFVDLSDAIDFIASALDGGDHGAIADACIAELGEVEGLPKPREYQLDAIEDLAGRHAGTSLRALYSGRAFPAREARFKLGGHGPELGHVHVDFVRSESGWQLENIWQCR
jgi:hypothetical protein